MAKRISISLLAALMMVMIGCGSAGSIVETKGLGAKLHSYDQLVVEVAGGQKVEAEHVGELRSLIKQNAMKSKMFKTVTVGGGSTSAGALVLKVTLNEVKDPEGGMGVKLGGLGLGKSSTQAEAKASAELMEAVGGTSRSLASVVARGDSSRKGRSSVSGGAFSVDTTSDTTLITDALNGIAEHLIQYIEDNSEKK